MAGNPGKHSLVCEEKQDETCKKVGLMNNQEEKGVGQQ